MYTVPIKHNGDDSSTIYKVYKQKEADKLDIGYKYWKEAEIGDYGLTDDKYVAKVINRKAYKSNHSKPNIYLRFPWGYTFFNPKYSNKELHAGGRKSNQTFTGKPHLEVISKQEFMKSLAVMYAIRPDYDLAIDWVFDNVSPKKRRKFKRIMKTEVFKKMVREELQIILKDHGMTEDFTLDLLDEVITLAKTKKDVTNLMRAIENLQDMHGMKDKHMVKTTDKIEATSTTRLIDDIREEENKLEAERVVVEPKDE